MTMTGPPADTDQLLRKADVARLLQVSGRTVDNLLRAGRLPEPMRLSTHPRWHREQLLEWLRDQADRAAANGTGPAVTPAGPAM